jgi:PAS domain S-box-containing protein
MDLSSSLTPGGDSSHTPARNRPQRGANNGVSRRLLAVFLVGAGLIASVTAYLIHRNYRNEMSYWQLRQTAIAEDRAEAISIWLSERRADVEVLAALPSVHVLLDSPSGAGSAVFRRQLSALFHRFRTVYGYSGISLLDAESRPILLSTDGDSSLADAGGAASEEDLSGAPDGFLIHVTGDSPPSSLLHFHMPVRAAPSVAPEAGLTPPVKGALLLEMPMRTLFATLAWTPLPSRTGETLLVRREGNEIVYLTPLRDPHFGSRGFFRRNLDSPRLPASHALQVGATFGEFEDYRGVPVLAATERIAQTGWGLVRKIDRQEALESFYGSALLEGLVGGLLIVLLGVSLRTYGRGQHTRVLEARVEKQQEILKLKEYSQEIVDSVPAGLLVVSPDLHILSTNPAFLQSFGLRPEEVVGRRLDELIRAESPPYRVEGGPEGHPAPENVLIDLQVGGGTEKRSARLTMKMLPHETEEVGEGRLLVVVEDLTASERLRAVAESSERRLRDLIQTVDAILWEAEGESRHFRFVSQRAEDVLGFPISQWLDEPDFWVRHLHPEDRERAVEHHLAAIHGGRDFEHEYRMIAADGGIVWLRDRVTVQKLGDENSQQIRGVMLDVTEQHLAEEERARLSQAVEQAAEAILMTDTDGVIHYVNPAFERVSGYTRAEVAGKTPRILRSGLHDAEFYRRLWDALLRGEVFTGHFINRRKDGSLYHAEAVISPVRDAGGRIVNFVAVQRDVTRERQLEEQVRQSQKIEAVGRLAGGVAHDFNNLLTIIAGYSQLALDRLKPDDPVATHVGEIKKAADRAASLTRQLLAFSRRQVLTPQILDLNAVVANMGKMLRRLIGEDVELETRLAPQLARVKADPGQIEQVILNLAVNARDAMPQGGRLMIETSDFFLDQDYAEAHFPIQPGNYVMLAVSDTGIGMDAETLEHIFEPFFTTKEQGKGTGLGLAMVYGIVKQSGGYIYVYSELGRGSTFKIYLPKAEVKEEEPEARVAEVRSLRGVETVLVVEDEGSVRDLVKGVLERHGYRVLEARNGAEALQVCERHAVPVHLTLTDVVMPQMSGKELADRLREKYPQMKFIFMSGYTEDTALHHRVLEKAAVFVQKPFAPEGLVRKIREVLDGTPDRSL